MGAPLADGRGRGIRYLRLSVTDHCNLRCVYCHDSLVRSHIPHDDVLRHEEMARLVDILHGMGVRKVRLTGGEPFARRGCDAFLAILRARHEDLDLRITTNATLLGPYIPLLKRVGVGAVNISLDSFDRDTFARVTGRDLLPAVLDALDGLLKAGLRVKINAVAMRGVNDGQMADFVHAARNMPVDVRFIEFMPMGGNTRWNEAAFWPADAILAEAGRFARLEPVPGADANDGPARMYAVAGGRGRIGLISPMSNHFCATCNRLRLTCEGRLRTCLFADMEHPLRPLLRDPSADDARIAAVIAAACRDKPVGADLLAARRGVAVAAREMVNIGG